MKDIKLEDEDRFVSFDVESLFTNVPVLESITVIEKRLKEDQELVNRTNLPVHVIIELLECCLTTTYFEALTDFYQQDDGLPMGSPLSPVIANIYMEFFEEYAMETARVKPKKWIRYVDDTFIIWNRSEKDLEEFFKHINSVRRSIKFTMEKETQNSLPFLDVLVERTGNNITTSVYRKPTHTGRYLNFQSNHSEVTKLGVAKTLLDRARSHCSTAEKYKLEVEEICATLKRNGYPENKIKRILKKHNTSSTTKEDKNECKELYIPYVKGISEIIKRAGIKYNIETRFQTTTKLRNILAKTAPPRTTGSEKGIYKIDCECGKVYVGETKRPLQTRIKEHKRHTERGETTKSGIADHAWEHHHRILWDQAEIIAREQNTFKRKFKEAAIIMNNKEAVYSQPSVEIRPLWKKFIDQESALKIEIKKFISQTEQNSTSNPVTLDSPDTVEQPVTLDHPHFTRYKARRLRNIQ